MPTYAKIENGVVANLVVATEDFAAEQGLVAATSDAEIGGTWSEADGFTRKAVESVPVSKSDVEEERDRRISAGHMVALSTGKVFKVQTRDARDWRNVNGLGAVGLAKKASGDTTTTTFRDADNQEHDLSPTELIEMGLQIAAKVDAIYNASWVLKDQTPIPANFKDDKYWVSP